MAKLTSSPKLKNRNEQGFSLSESMAGLVIATVTLAVAAPLFMQQHVSNINSEIRTGAASLAQQMLDSMRYRNPAQLPLGASQVGADKTYLSSPAIGIDTTLNLNSAKGFFVGQHISVGGDSDGNIIKKIDGNTITLTQELGSYQDRGAVVSLSSLGYPFDTTVHVCTQVPTVSSNGSVTCPTGNADTTAARHIVVQIENNGQKIYTVETVYTQLRQEDS